MNKPRLISIIAAILLVLNVVLLYTLQKGKKHPKKGFNPVEMISHKLDFNEEQKSELEEIIHFHRRESRKINEQRKQMRDQLFGSLKTEGQTDKEDQDQLIEKLAELQKASERLTYEHFEQIKNLCSPAQKERFDSFVDELGKRPGPGGPQHRPGPPPPRHRP